MRKIRTSSKAEMIATFLAAELHALRSMGQELQACLQREALSPQIILSPDLTNTHENAARCAVLGAYAQPEQWRAFASARCWFF